MNPTNTTQQQDSFYSIVATVALTIGCIVGMTSGRDAPQEAEAPAPAVTTQVAQAPSSR